MKNQLEILQQQGCFDIKIQGVKGSHVQLEDGRWITDYATTGYLGLDLRSELHELGSAYSSKWGSICNWSRMELDPVIFGELEERIRNWLGCEEVVLGHTITISSFSVLPYIARDAIILADSLLHTVIWEACRLSRDHGSELQKFKHQDLDDLECKLKALPLDKRKIIAVDGVYSISTEVADVKRLQQLCEQYNAYLYIDDAHGIGVLGGNPTPENPYGVSGNGVVNYAGCDFNRTFYVSSFGKAFGSTVAFLCYPKEFHETLRANCLQYLFSAPVNPYTIGTAMAAMDLNEREGELLRARVRSNVTFFRELASELSLEYLNQSYHPVLYVKIGTIDELLIAAKGMLSKGSISGYRAFPLVKEQDCGMRFSLSALHSRKEITATLVALSELKHNKNKLRIA